MICIHLPGVFPPLGRGYGSVGGCITLMCKAARAYSYAYVIGYCVCVCVYVYVCVC
jgi:hypothetical protein